MLIPMLWKRWIENLMKLLPPKKLMAELKDLFLLPHRPQRVEVYDNSHLQGTSPYGVMVVATDQGFQKNPTENLV